MKVSDVVKDQKLVTARLDMPVGDVADVMKRERLTGIPVVDEWGAIAGLVTSSMLRDLARAWEPQGAGLEVDHGWHGRAAAAPSQSWTSLLAKDVMTSDLCTVMSSDELRDAAKAMTTRGVHRAIVLGADRNVHGVLSSLDFVELCALGKLKD